VSILALYHMKGGVGKTTAAVNFAYLAARDGKRTLLIDLDPQGSASFYFRVRSNKSFSVKSLAKRKRGIERNIKGSDFDSLDILPATLSYRKLDIALSKFKKPKARLLKICRKLKKQYDMIIIDAPAGLDLVAENVFAAADIILLPLIPTTLSVVTLHQLYAFLNKKKLQKKKFHIFFSMVEKRKKLHQNTMPDIREEFKRVYIEFIPCSAVVEKMGVQRQPLPVFAPRSKASQSFFTLWNEVKNEL